MDRGILKGATKIERRIRGREGGREENQPEPLESWDRKEEKIKKKKAQVQHSVCVYAGEGKKRAKIQEEREEEGNGARARPKYDGSIAGQLFGLV